MKTIYFALFLLLAGNLIAQKSEMTITVKSIGVDQEEAYQSPYITYINEAGKEQYFNYTLPEVGMEEYAVIMVGEEVLIKIGTIDRNGENPGEKRILTYEFNESIAKKLIGKKIKLHYTAVGLNNYLYSIELLNG